MTNGKWKMENEKTVTPQNFRLGTYLLKPLPEFLWREISGERELLDPR